MSTMPLTFKVASEEWEFEQIHQLNYRTFVEEIPQHSPNSENALIDKFHHENRYMIALDNAQLVGMVAVRDKRPFSLDSKLEELDKYLPPHNSVFEIRLLAVDKEYRRARVIGGLMHLLSLYRTEKNHDLAIMSGTVRESRLYKHLGFQSFGPLVGDAQAQYQPMYLDMPTFVKIDAETRIFSGVSAPASRPVNLLPGPVSMSEAVRNTFADPPISHRSAEFMQKLAETKQLLCQLVRAESVELFMSSGTLANDVVAGQLSLLHQPGVLLNNGEFGNRLCDHATRFGLSFQTMRAEWGDPFDLDAVRQTLATDPDIGWLWAVHCETSSGVLTDIHSLQEICDQHDVRLCLDCTSSIGTIPVNLSRAYLATSVSGKGLRSFAGVAMVFYNHHVSPMPTQLPRYLDLGLYAASTGVPFTISSNLVYALHSAVAQCNTTRFDEIKTLSTWIRTRLTEADLQIVSPADQTSPAVITIALPETVCSESTGDQLEEAGYLLSYRSQYLLDRNWIQICLMGECTREEIEPLLGLLEKLTQ